LALVRHQPQRSRRWRFFADSASAADLAMPMKAPPPLPVFCWTGFYIGADVGYAWGDTTTEYLTATNTFTGFNPSYKINSAVGGLYGGYNYQIGSAVLGIESDIEAANIRGGFNDPLVEGPGPRFSIGRVHSEAG
jgi:opacity protein-like surface antigen